MITIIERRETYNLYLLVQIDTDFRRLTDVIPPQSVVVPITEINSNVYRFPGDRFSNITLSSANVDWIRENWETLVPFSSSPTTA